MANQEENKLDEMIRNAATPELKAMYQKAKDNGLVIKKGVNREPAIPFKESEKTPSPFSKYGNWIPENERHNIQMIPRKDAPNE